MAQQFIPNGAFGGSSFKDHYQPVEEEMIDEQGNVSKLAFLRMLINEQYSRMNHNTRRKLDKRKTI